MDLIVENALKNNSNNFNSDNMEIGKANIKVIGVGGAGNNMVNWLYKKGIRGAEIIACNTDKQHLDATEADKKLMLGTSLTRGLGCGGFPAKGSEAAKETIQEIKEFVDSEASIDAAVNNVDRSFKNEEVSI